jgi:uncharacterized protein
MKQIKISILTISIAILGNACNQQSTNPSKINQSKQTFMPDTTLIKQLGADEYGMKIYSIVYLKAGGKLPADSVAAVATQKQHLRYLKDLMDKGTMLILGPIMEEAAISGICIYNTTVDEAKKLAEADPAVISGELTVEVHPWYASAALMKLPEMHKAIEAKSFADMQ